jgi:DNA polymerase III delta prime subunit
MIPPQIGLHSDPPPGEEELFRKLSRGAGTDEWIVLHSLDVARHRSNVSGEIDFVLLVPESGVLCVEVKSHHHIVYDRGRWLFGPEQEERKDPFRQVRETMHSLVEDVKPRNENFRETLFWSSVCFPRTVFQSHSPQESSPEWNEWELIDANRLQREGVARAFRRVLKRAAHHLEDTGAAWFSSDRSLPSRGQCEQIADVLRPRFEFFESPASRARRREEELKHYTEQQFRALDHMERNPRVLFEGPAGTGKTFLALEAARRADSSGEKTLFLCYNRNLGNRLREATVDLENVEAQTLHTWMVDLTGASGGIDDDRFWRRELPDHALRKILEANKPIYDRLIVDEAQDLLKPAYLDVMDALLDGGLQHGRWMIAGDFVNQNIYSDAELPGEKTLTPDQFFTRRGLSAPRFSLTENCRNTPEVANFVEEATGMDPGYRDVLRPAQNIDPVIRTVESIAERSREIQSIIEDMYDRGVTGEDIVLLSRYRLDRPDSALAGLSRHWKQRVRGYQEDGQGYIRHSTIWAFKGLEAPVVIVTDLDRVNTPRGRELLYVAASRSQERLYLLLREEEKNRLLSDVLYGKNT